MATDYPLYPHSPTIDAAVDGGIIDDIATEARNAFFAVVVERFNDYYPGSTTYGDEDPGESIDRDRIARTWVESFAWNNSAVQEYAEEWCVVSDVDATEPSTLMDADWPEGLAVVEVGRFHGREWPSVTLRGTRLAIVTFLRDHWGVEDEGWNAYEAGIEVDPPASADEGQAS